MSTKILIVDDEPAIGKLLTYQLRGFDYNVSYTPDGLAALEKIERECPDLVLLDVMMPIINGWEVCRQIRTSSAIPIIMLTAKNSDADIVTGLTAGADDYIAKPFSMAQLHARIEAVLRRTRSGSRPRMAAVPAEPTPKPLAAGSTRLVVPEPLPATVTLPTAPAPAEPDPATHTKAEPATRLGPQLHAARMSRGITLAQAARDCDTRWEFLQAIEQENYSYVPRLQLRAAIQRYTEYLDMAFELPKPTPRPHPRRSTHVLQYATIVTIMLLVIAVGMYFL